MSTTVLDATPESFPERLFHRAFERKPFDKLAMRALMKAIRLLSLALGQRLAELRASDDKLEQALAATLAGATLVQVLRETVDLLGTRLDKLPPRRRPHYTPVQRFRILELMHLAGFSQNEAARSFRVAITTIGGWATSVNPNSSTVGSTVKPTPPVRRYADTVHHLVQTVAGLGFEGYGTIARHLAAAGWRVARSTVRRHLKEGPVLPEATPPAPETPKRAVVARYPHHVWHLDLSEIPGFLSSPARQLAVILDSFSRVPITAKLFLGQPSAAEMIALVEGAFARHGKPRYLIVDQAGYFTARAFRERIQAWAVNLRFCSAENHRANAKLERFWGTLKHTLLDLRVPVNLKSNAELGADLDRALRYYTLHRPHSRLAGATPGEALAAVEPQCLTAVQPPRGRPGENVANCRVLIDRFEGDHRLPLLRKAA